MNEDLSGLLWQPVILLKSMCVPFGGFGGVSVKRAYLAVHGSDMLYADWTLEASERRRELVCATGWTLRDPLVLPFRLEGRGAHLIPSGTWVMPYDEHLFSLYSRLECLLDTLGEQIDQQPISPQILALLHFLTQTR